VNIFICVYVYMCVSLEKFNTVSLVINYLFEHNSVFNTQNK